ncbi:MAG: hypothetical protein JXR03_17480 [Cyclobacteriaceae bacterium]
MSAENRNIEDFFKKRLESKEFPFEEAHWDQLNDKLDAAGMYPNPGFFGIFKFKFIIIGLIAIIFSFFAGWLVHDSIIGDQIVEDSDASRLSSIQPKSEILLDEEEVCDDEIHCEDENIVVQEISEKRLVSERTKIIQSIPKQDLESKGEEAKPPKTDSSTPAILSLPSGIANVNGVNSSSVSTDDNNVRENHNVEEAHNSKKELDDSEEELTEYPIIKLPLDGIDLEEFFSKDDWTSPDFQLIILEEEEDEDEEIVQHVKKPSRFSIGISLSPDLNGVGFGNKMSASIRPGVTVYYRVLPRVTVSTGAHFDQKRYETSAENYNPPTGFWGRRTNGVLPSVIDGSCRVIDIPVNVTIKLTDNPRVNYGGTVGISSYFLLDEAYEFEFAQDNPGAASGWSTDENSSVPVGLVNMSLYMSIPTGRRTEFLIEPYFKSPIKDVGWAKVALYGSGVQFTLKYNFSSIRKTKE